MSLLDKSISLFHDYVKNKFIRFIFVGGLNTLFGYGIYCLMLFLGFPYIWATLVSHILGVLFNFMTTGVLVFENDDPGLIFRFVISYIITYFINIGSNGLLQSLTGFSTYLTGIGATIVAAVCSFFILRLFVYGGKKED